jgi:hypothetical protein
MSANRERKADDDETNGPVGRGVHWAVGGQGVAMRPTREEIAAEAAACRELARDYPRGATLTVKVIVALADDLNAALALLRAGGIAHGHPPSSCCDRATKDRGLVCDWEIRPDEAPCWEHQRRALLARHQQPADGPGETR